MEFPCPGCGAELHWSPGEGALQCGHCGTVSEPPGSDAPIVEYRLTEAALAAPTGYAIETRTLKCSACGAIHDVAPEIEVTRCPFCSATQVAPHEGAAQVIRPESVVPFAVDRNAAKRKFRGWLGSLWLRPSALTSSAQLESISGAYIPAWTFDAHARSRWTAEAGYRERVQRRVTVTRDGKRVTEMQTVTEVRWEPASGRRQGDYDDWVVQASGGLDQAAVKVLLPFKLEELKPYDAAYLSGFIAERYQLPLDGAWQTAQVELQQAERTACRSDVPGDTQRGLAVNTEFSEVHFKHLLLPVWIAAYRYQGQVYRYLVNGQTGKATGDAPYSMLKIVLLVIAIIVVVLGCMGLLSLTGAAGVAASQ